MRRTVHHRGLSLIEAVISTLIVGIMIAASFSTIGATARSRSVQKDESRGPQLAHYLLSEILQMPFGETGDGAVFGTEPDETSTTREDFDDVDDYHNFYESPPRAKEGSALPNVTGWTWWVGIHYANKNTPATSTSLNQGLKRISVTVMNDATGEMTVLVALRSHYGTYEYQPSEESTFVNWVGVDLQVGDKPSNRAVSGTNLMNSVATQ